MKVVFYIAAPDSETTQESTSQSVVATVLHEQAGPETLNEGPQPLSCTIVAWVQDGGSVSGSRKAADRFLYTYKLCRKKAPPRLGYSTLRRTAYAHSPLTPHTHTHVHGSSQTSVDPCKNSTLEHALFTTTAVHYPKIEVKFGGPTPHQIKNGILQ